MKTRNIKLYLLLFGILMGIFACQPKDYSLGSILTKEDLDYSITQNPNDPNMVILQSFTPGATPLWVTPVGRSTKMVDTVRLAFAGDYQFSYGVQSNGGFVQDDVYNLTITGNNFEYVNDPLWELLTGGVGESKTWVLDLFTQDVAPNFSKYFVGPQYFWGTEDSWVSFHLLADGMSREDVNAQLGLTSDTGWNWDADWAGNGSWLWGGEPAQDYGTMTFDLIDGPHIIVDNLVTGVVQNGTYMFDAAAKTMRTTDAEILHPAALQTQVSDWTDITVMNLTENTLQLGVIRTEGDPAKLVFNFISKEYSDSWVAPDLPDPEPTLPDGWQEDISQVVSNTIQWKLSESNPLDWANLDGSMMNGWQAPEDYPDWLGTPDPAVYGDFSMTMNSVDGTVEFVTPDGNVTAGNFTIDEKGIYSFDVPVPSFTIVNWASFYADANNQFRILQIEKDAGGQVTGMWLGAKDATNPQYSAFHLVPQMGGGDSEPEGTEVPFDNSKLVTGDLEANGNFRLELYNDFGGTTNDPPLDPTAIAFANRAEITFTLSGVSYVEGAAGSYTTNMLLVDPNWGGYWGGGAGEVSVNGDGTYTVYCDVADFNTAMVFVIDIQGMGAELTDIAAVSATIDSIVLY